MLTLFTTAKPFKGHIGIIQRNALRSWKGLDRDVDVIVFGDDEGSAGVCQDLGLRYEPSVARTASGAILLNDMFGKAQAMARHELLCYANCDILLMQDFAEAVRRVSSAHREFLMAGRRWDVDIAEPMEFANVRWEDGVRRLVARNGKQRGADWIDYFAFSRGLYEADTPAFAIGRTCWDNWLVWRALEGKKAVVDASRAILAVHQNHDYNHHPQGWQGVWQSEDARRNAELSGGRKRLATLHEATFVLRDGEIMRNGMRGLLKTKQVAAQGSADMARFLTYNVWLPAWHFVLKVTRPLRSALGLRLKSSRR